MLYLIPLAEILVKELRGVRARAVGPGGVRGARARVWREREFDELGYLRIKGARKLDPTALSVLRELYLMRDQKAREMDRPPFKVLGNRTLLEIAERQPKQARRARGDQGHHGSADPAARARRAERGARRAARPSTVRSRSCRRAGAARMDRHAERRLLALKQWRTRRAAELAMDPGVLCPNSALEAIARARRRTARTISRVSPS